MQATITEAELIRAGKAGEKGAFRPVVDRYKTLVCAITYSGTGDFPESRRLAREAFVKAFKSLDQLRDATKFRSMLCRITRNLVVKSVRKNRFDIVNDAESAEPLQVDLSEIPVKADRQALVWNAISGIPEKYREPLVFFYQRRSSEPAVAGQLELAEPILVQFVSHARSMLRPEVASLVQDILGKTAPGESFVDGVLDEIAQISEAGVESSEAFAPGKGKKSEHAGYVCPSGAAPMTRAALRVAFGGCIFGGVAWLLPTSIMATDWTAAVGVLAAAGLVFLVATTLCLRNQAKRWQILGWVVGALCALNLAVINLRWNRWVEAYEQNPAYNSPAGLSRWTLNIIIAAIMAALLLIFITLDSRQRRQPPQD